MAAEGNIRVTQVRSGDRTGTGSRLVAAATGTLTQNVPLLYDASGNVVATATRSGNTTKFTTASGSLTINKQLAFDSSGNIIASAIDIGGGGGPGYGVDPTQPVVASYSWVNQGTSTAVDTGIGIFLEGQASSGHNFRMLVKSAPSTPYRILAAFSGVAHHPAASNEFGLVWRQSSDGKIITARTLIWNNSVNVSQWSSPSTYVGDYAAVTDALRNLKGQFYWMSLEDDGTDRIIKVSQDGLYWATLIVAHSRTNFLTADQVGFFVNSNSATYKAGMHLVSWEETT